MDLPRKAVQPVGWPGSDRGVRADGIHPGRYCGQTSGEVLHGRAIQGKWTPNEIIGHLTDSDWVYGYRLRLILCEDEPAILGIRQDAWVASLHHNEREPSELVEIFRTLRVLNLSVWRRMSQEDLQRSGQHNERGAESLAAMLQLLAGHDLSHLHQISRYIQALEARG
jgi:hypothetical protein